MMRYDDHRQDLKEEVAQLKGKIEALMQEKGVSFSELSTYFTCSKQTLTRKINGTLEWTYNEMVILSDVLGIVDLADFFFNHKDNA